MPCHPVNRALLLTLSLALVACQGVAPTGPAGGGASGSVAAPNVPAGSGVIRGRVDVDTGSLISDGSQFRLLLQAGAVGGTVYARGDAGTYETPVNSDGTFSMVVKGGSEYALEAVVPDGKGGVTRCVTPTPVMVPLADEPPIVDAASLVTRRTGSIQGLVELQGAATGETPVGADVFLTGGTAVVGKAGETGRFALTNVAEGTWNVVVSLPGYRRQVVKGVVVRPGRPSLLETPVVLERETAPQSAVTGGVQTSDGKAIIGASVALYPKDRQALAESDVGLESFIAITDDQGRYALANVPPGEYSLQVYRPFYQVPPRQSVTVVAGGPQDVGVTRLVSTVAHFGKIAGVVVDEADNPVDGAVAQLDPPVTESQSADATGQFTLDRILPGQYNLTVAAGGYKPVIVPVLVDNTPNFSVTLPAAVKLVKAAGREDAPTIVPIVPAPPAPSSTPTERPSEPAPTPTMAPPTPLPTASPTPRAWVVTTLAGGDDAALVDGAGSDARFGGLERLKMAPEGGALYVADDWNWRIRKVTLAGLVSTVGGSIFRPHSVAFDADGSIFGLDYFSGEIEKLSPTGVFERFAGGTTREPVDAPRLEAGFSTVGDAVVADDGTMYVADTGNHRIRTIAPDGMVSTLAGSRDGFRNGMGAEARFNRPMGLALGPDGALYVADMSNHRIRRVTREGAVSVLAGVGGIGYVNGTLAKARFNNPSALAFGPDGVLYVADSGNHCIRVVSPDGQVSTLAGPDPAFARFRDPYGMVDGPAAAARFKYPRGIAVGPDGEVYVSDSENHRIRVVR